jgi:serine phosphatase RsbU (regulator of sigma subunit)
MRTAVAAGRMLTREPDITLHTLAGPHGGSYSSTGSKQMTIGRAIECDICLLNEAVSRRHAVLSLRDGAWFIMDVGSVIGTWVNGQRLSTSVPLPLVSGDLVRIGPWSFRVAIGLSSPSTSATIDDDSRRTARIERVGERPLPAGARQLRMLMEGLARMASAPDEASLARSALEAALAGAGSSRGAVLRPTGGVGDELGIVAFTGPRSADGSPELTFSRTLIHAASGGQTAILHEDQALGGEGKAQSVCEFSIRWAVCAPVFVGNELVALLYIDAQHGEGGAQGEAASFCEAISNACGLALSNLKRMELERRQSALAAELSAAREAQQFIMPPAQAAQGFLGYAMQMRPGVFVAGDLFDVVPLGDGRVAICLGDVSGHGAASAMLMAAAQSQLNAQILATRDPAKAVSGLNRYLGERSLGGRFVSLWLGVFSPDGTVEYVDAGHGYWFHRTGATLHPSQGGTAIPVGIDPETRYHSSTIRLAPSDRIILYSDGILDERNASGEPFGNVRLEQALAPSRGCDADIVEIFKAIARFADGAPPSDDATAASIEYLGSAE